MTLPILLLVLAFVPLALEARRSRAHDRELRAQGAWEPENDVYRAMQVAYPASFAAMALEAWLRSRSFNGIFAVGALVFVAAKWLKYWAIASLGPRWTFRVLVLPASPLVTRGPYRHLRHPNYLGVAGELAGMALMAQAPVAGMSATLIFGALLLARIRVENTALASKRTGSRVL